MKIRGLFWKIFLAFWVANLLVVAATSYLIYSDLESRNFKERKKNVIENLSLVIVNRYEAEGKSFSRRAYNKLLKQKPMFNKDMWRPRFQILDGYGDVVFSSRFPRRGIRNLSNQFMGFSVTSDSGRDYRVESFVNPPPRFILNSLQRINFFQFFFVLISSAAVSFLLSWSFAKPLRTLGAYSRRYASGDTKTQIEKKLLERFDEIGDLARDLNYMGAQVEQTISSQKQLLHDVSHELRAPLARLQALAGILEQRTAGGADEVERIHKECLRIDELIQQILNLSRAEKLEAQKSERDIVAFLREQIEAISIEYPGRKVNFQADVAQCVLCFNEYALDTALHNVLANACKYTAEDTVIDVRIKTSAKAVTIAVRDYGEGVDEQDLAHLLTPFYRAGNKMHSEGFGLGLSIAQRALRASGGDISLRNHPEGGLEVTLSFANN